MSDMEARPDFELRFLKSSGTAFQSLFEELMEQAYPKDFQAVRAYGSTGDYKCDGYLRSRRIVFQVYGPTHLRLRTFLKKLRDDFKGACLHWAGRMDKWVFVHNQRTGLPPQAVQAVEELALLKGSPLVEVWGYEELRLLTQVGETLTASHVLPSASEVERYWAWLTHLKEERSLPDHLSGLRNLNLPQRLISPPDARQEEREQTGSTTASRWGQLSLRSRERAEGRRRSLNLKEALASHRRLLIIGESGSGKSTLLRQFAHKEAGRLKYQTFENATGQTPIIVELWRFASDRSLWDLICASVGRSQAGISNEELRNAIHQGYAVLLLDGLDEVASDLRKACLAQIANFSEDHPAGGLVVTSRPFPHPPDDFHLLTLASLTDQDIEEALLRQFGSVKAFRSKFEPHSPASFVESGLRPAVKAICRRPLTLGLILTLLENGEPLSGSLFATYERIASLLFDWELRKGNLDSHLAITQSLEEVAYPMASREHAISATDVAKLIRQVVIAATPRGDWQSIYRVMLSSGIIEDFGGTLFFSHRSFQEYFAAKRILSSQAEPWKDRLALNPGVALFLCGAMADVTKLLEEHLLHGNALGDLEPLLNEASGASAAGGRFELLYRAIMESRELGLTLDWSPLDEEEHTALVEKIVDTCVEFGPWTISLLKDAVHGILMNAHLGHAQTLFSSVVAGLSTLEWSGATIHEKLLRTDFFGAIELFTSDEEFELEDGSVISGTEMVETLYEYLDAMGDEDFRAAESCLKMIATRLGEWAGRRWWDDPLDGQEPLPGMGLD